MDLNALFGVYLHQVLSSINSDPPFVPEHSENSALTLSGRGGGGGGLSEARMTKLTAANQKPLTL